MSPGFSPVIRRPVTSPLVQSILQSITDGRLGLPNIIKTSPVSPLEPGAPIAMSSEIPPPKVSIPATVAANKSAGSPIIVTSATPGEEASKIPAISSVLPKNM